MKTHKCKECPFGVSLYEFESVWLLEIKTVEDICGEEEISNIAINCCPFCGKHLEADGK